MGDLPHPWGRVMMSETVLLVTLEGGAINLQGEEARDAAQHPGMRPTAPPLALLATVLRLRGPALAPAPAVSLSYDHELCGDV